MLIMAIKSSICSDFNNYNKYFTCYYNKYNKIKVECCCCHEYHSSLTPTPTNNQPQDPQNDLRNSKLPKKICKGAVHRLTGVNKCPTGSGYYCGKKHHNLHVLVMF